LIPPRRAIALATMLALAGCAAALVFSASAAPPPEAADPTPNPRRPEALPVTPVPVPSVVIVQTPAPPTPPAPVTAPPPAAQAPLNEDEQQALALLADLHRYVSDPAEDLKRELVGANAALARTRSDANRIRVAMLLTLPAAGPPDDARAPSLLEPVVGKTVNNSPLKQIGTLLYAQIVERARSLREEQKRTAAAQEKLDALRAVERSLLLERSRNAGGGSAGGGGGTGR
jgi:hypothetical protein